MRDESYWIARREELTLDAGVTNLNAGSCSPCPRVVASEILRVTKAAAGDPVNVFFREAAPRMELGRQAVAKVLDADANNLLLFSNASYGVNTVLQSLPFKPGDELLTTDQEYGHYLPLFRLLERERGIKVIFVEIPRADKDASATPETVVEAFRKHLTTRTRLVFFSHITSVTGTVMPATSLCKLARDHGAWSMIDGAHAPGMVAVSLRTIGADFYAANLHKWLMGPTGSAILHVRRECRALIRPLIVMLGFDYKPAEEDLHYGEGPTRWALSHEYQGTRNLAPFMTLDLAMAFYTETATAGMPERMRMLARRCRELLEASGLTAVTPSHPELASSMVAFHYPGKERPVEIDKTWRRLRQKHQVEVLLPVLMDGTPLLRVSNAWFNDVTQLEQFAELVKTFDW